MSAVYRWWQISHNTISTNAWWPAMIPGSAVIFSGDNLCRHRRFNLTRRLDLMVSCHDTLISSSTLPNFGLITPRQRSNMSTLLSRSGSLRRRGGRGREGGIRWVWAVDKERDRVWVPPSEKVHITDAVWGARERISDSGVEGGVSICCCHGLQGRASLLPAGVPELVQRSRHHRGESHLWSSDGHFLSIYSIYFYCKS